MRFKNNASKIKQPPGIIDIPVGYTRTDNIIVIDAVSSNPIMNSFQKVHGILYNNVPIAGYLRGVEKKGEKTKYFSPASVENEESRLKLDNI